MNFQDAAKAWYSQALGGIRGSYAELATQYFQAISRGDISGAGEISVEDVAGLQAALADLTSRVEALEP